MSYRVKGTLSVVAVLATLGAVQFASGHDLTIGLAMPGTPGHDEVNHSVKADREATAIIPSARTRTISIRVDRLPNTSVLVRIPQAQEARNAPRRLFIKAGERRPTVACEPTVSVLTDIARQLQPGRCVT
jgi:hypothetical protein